MTHRIFVRVAAHAFIVASAACGPGSGGREAVGSSSSASTVTATGVDYSWARPSPGGLKSEGYTFAARYLSYDTTGKSLSSGEASALWAAGVDVVVVWEQSGTAALSGYSQGASDAAAAESQASADGAPAGRPIYFAVDFDASPSDQPAIDAYFDGVASVIGLPRTGAYAGFYVIQRLFNDGKIKWGWQTYAWSGGQWDSRAQLQQVLNGITAAGDSSCCDEDQAVATDFGQWHAAPANTPPRGYLDSAACTGIAGWSQDQDVPTSPIDVDVYFNAAAGSPGSEGIRIVAGDARSDLCTAIGSCDHGFVLGVPVGLLDGKAHSVYAYGIDSAGGPNTLLIGSPRTFTCPNAGPPLDEHAGVKRHVIDPTSMTAWAFSYMTDVAPETDAVVGAYPERAAWPEVPSLVQADDGTPEVWLLDGDVRRHVVSPDSLTAWHRTFAEVVKTPAATVYGYARGPDLPAAPFLMIGSGPAVWVLDVASSSPSLAAPPLPGMPEAPYPAAPPIDKDPKGRTGESAAGNSQAAGGCAVHTSTAAGGPAWVFAFGIPLLAFARRRRRGLAS